MATEIKPELSKKNPYYIPRHRYYELKHFSLQYKDFKKLYSYLQGRVIEGYEVKERIKTPYADRTGDVSVSLALLGKNIDIIEKAAYEASPELSDYILKAVTEGYSYTKLSMKMTIPCGRDMFYLCYRKYFYLLSMLRTY